MIMQKILYPNQQEWESLCKRPELMAAGIEKTIEQIFNDIRQNGDKAVKKYTNVFDGVKTDNLKVTEDEITEAITLVPRALKQAISLAKNNIEKFHTSQKESIKVIETTPGVKCWRESRPIESVGIYIPGGSAPLFSTVLMLGIPAKIAGCSQVVLCSPPGKDGKINPAIIYAANLVGITSIYAVGGIQAIGAMCFGTGSVPKAGKIFGPGNQFVTAAKQYALKFGTAIDLPAGPSELLIIADGTAVPEFIAADLLSQAEHGADSQVVLLSPDKEIIRKTLAAVKTQVKSLPRKNIIVKALENSKAIVLQDIAECIQFSNAYAPEHLIICADDMPGLTGSITNAGSVFLGNYSCESAGDYASGTNHTLPTNGYARNYSGVSLDSFVKKVTFQEISVQGLINIGPAIEIMAAAEQLDAHRNAVSLRLKTLIND
jgi:histidinol dehydrogenase